MDGKIRLSDDDWKYLLPSEEYKIGKTSIYIKPLGIERLALMLNQVGKIMLDWKEIILETYVQIESEDIKQTNGNKKKKRNQLIKAKTEKSLIEQLSKILPKLSTLIAKDCPDIISELSNIDIEDIKALPLNEAIKLFNFCIGVNIKSQEGLEKNLVSLTDSMKNMISVSESQMDKTIEQAQV